MKNQKNTFLKKRKPSVLLFISVLITLTAFLLSSTGCNKSKITIKEWLSTEDGKEYVDELKKSVPDENVPEFNYFAEADNVVIAEYVCKPDMTMDYERLNSIVNNLKSDYQYNIQQFMDKYDMEEYSVVMRYKSSDGIILGERIITRTN